MGFFLARPDNLNPFNLMPAKKPTVSDPNPFEYPLYVYRTRIKDIVDGDTLIVDIDLGFGTWLHNQKLRLAKINAPELSTPEGVASRNHLAQLTLDHEACVVQTFKDRKEKYGRWLAQVFLLGPKNTMVHVNQRMLDLGAAKPA